ncbi:D-isomer specific 2-hydroxyacid dehydrogenase [Paraphoma chrysanthemicola]|uniref:D-isomer specific 2-hydroxyacid dehydrogenase n=1 Tax=Paraphoma chrysanthemicola TaxID=798071 RepID=A0A8K0QZY6_9PLEO|nr:D-isomer specific 2-hydroxyacid dehydrogenase [Paraphoma chrysanthemicola]
MHNHVVHQIVALEKQHQPLPTNGFDFPSTLTAYEKTSTREELHERVRNATIVITTTVKLDAETLHPDVTPRLQYIAVSATGTDPVDLVVAKQRGIRVTNCPGANLDAVSEHAISLYFAARRRTVLLDRKTREQPSEWKQQGTVNRHMRLPDGSPPLTCREEVLGVVGYGGLGKRIADLGHALGMRVLIASRKAAESASLGGSLPTPKVENDRVPFDDVLRQATVLVLSLPRNLETLNLLSTAEFGKMHPYAVVINIARGGIVDEAAIVQALKDKQIAGYATDVYQVEPVGGPEDTPLLAEDAKDLNITMTPHLAWFSQRTLKNLGDVLKATVEAWASGQDINVIV